jgi:F-type H+-transporting ATPase subunit gamma
MGAKLRVIRRRMRSVNSTMKITRAMELIAASRIVKAQGRVEASRPYAERLTAAMEDVARQSAELSDPLLEERPEPRVTGVLVITSDRGLAGAYNSNVLRRTEQVMADVRGRGLTPLPYVVGKKGVSYFRFRAIEMQQTWTGVSEVPPYDAAVEIGHRLIADYSARKIDELQVVYTDFRSAFTLRTTDKRFLPIAPEEVGGGATNGEPSASYIFEPEPDAILGELLPQYLVTKVYSAMLESAASESASRRRAMKAATDNADELIKVLSRIANQGRQAEITTEISEIVGGAEALKASGE